MSADQTDLSPLKVIDGVENLVKRLTIVPGKDRLSSSGQSKLYSTIQNSIAFHSMHPKDYRTGPALIRSVRLANWRNRDPFPTVSGTTGRNGWRSGRPIAGRTGHSDDAQHFPLRRCLR